MDDNNEGCLDVDIKVDNEDSLVIWLDGDAEYDVIDADEGVCELEPLLYVVLDSLDSNGLDVLLVEVFGSCRILDFELVLFIDIELVNGLDSELRGISLLDEGIVKDDEGDDMEFPTFKLDEGVVLLFI